MSPPSDEATDPADKDDAERRRLGARFGGVAAAYDRARPAYAAAALDWALPADARQVLDLAAGTGKLTALVAATGRSVVAIDPSPEMLVPLRARLLDTDARVGSAEATGLPDAWVDAVVIGSALHWFDRPAADHEIARVLRPGGVVAVFGNRRDASVPWVAALDELLDHRTRMRHHPLGREQVAFDPAWFSAPDRAEFPFTQTLDADGLAELFASRSYVIDLPATERADMMDRIRDFARTHPDLAGRGTFELPYATRVSRSVRR